MADGRDGRFYLSQSVSACKLRMMMSGDEGKQKESDNNTYTGDGDDLDLVTLV